MHPSLPLLCTISCKMLHRPRPLPLTISLHRTTACWSRIRSVTYLSADMSTIVVSSIFSNPVSKSATPDLLLLFRPLTDLNQKSCLFIPPPATMSNWNRKYVHLRCRPHPVIVTVSLLSYFCICGVSSPSHDLHRLRSLSIPVVSMTPGHHAD